MNITEEDLRELIRMAFNAGIRRSFVDDVEYCDYIFQDLCVVCIEQGCYTYGDYSNGVHSLCSTHKNFKTKDLQ